jgi:PIN domain nuclease of toxin-antitoxin system
MKALLDTHVLLWWVENNPQLSNLATDVITNPHNDLYVSVASCWEIMIKFNTGKLPLPEPPVQFIQSCLSHNQFQSLAIELPHILQIANLPEIHKDPFDRILIAQAQVEKMPILTVDRLIIQYPVQTIW